MFLRRNNHYDRTRIIEAAEQARSKGRARKAVGLYRRVLAVEPQNTELHRKLAPLLAKIGQRFDAWWSYRNAGRALLREQQLGAAADLYREATEHLPTQVEAWHDLASIELQRRRGKEALKALAEGRRHFRSAGKRPEAISLLRRMREIAPWHPATVLDLARLLAGSRQKPEAQWLLEKLAERTGGPTLRRIRFRQWRLEPSLLHTWYWLRSIWSPGEERRDAGASGPRSQTTAPTQ